MGTLYPKIKCRRGTDAQRQNVVLENGELFWTTDTYDLYIGDGITAGGIIVDVGEGSGDVVGPSSATNEAICLFDGTTGKAIKNSTITVNAGNITIPGNSICSVFQSSGDLTIDASSAAATTTVTIVNGAGAQVANLDVENNITLGGTVDGVDVAADSSTNATHRSSDGTDHTYIDQDVRISASPTFDNVYTNNLQYSGDLSITASNAISDTTVSIVNPTGNVANLDVEGDIIVGGSIKGVENSETILIENPDDSYLRPAFITNKAITITEIQTAIVGGTSVVWSLYQAATAGSTTTLIETGTCSSSTPASDISMSGDSTVPENQVINLDIGTVTGSVTDFILTFWYTED